MDALEKAGNANVSSVQGTFSRKETKYRLSPTQFESLMGAIGDRLEEEPFGRSKVSSLYYDTPAFDLISRSLEKPLYKEKLRIRAYGAYDPDAAFYVELKKKFKGIVYKRRIQLSEKAAYLLMAARPYEQVVRSFPLAQDKRTMQMSAQVESQIAHELEACVKRYPRLKPAMMVVVDRLPLRSTDGSDVRITFDFDARYRTENLAFSQKAPASPIFPDGQIVMEVKCQGAYPLWLVAAFNRVEAYCRPCSKYGAAYERLYGGQPVRATRGANAPRPSAVFSPLFHATAANAR